MKRLVCAVLAVMAVACGTLPAAESSTPVKLSLWPPVSTSRKPNVSGLDFGLIAAGSRKVEGFQLALAYADVKQTSYGAQMAVYARSKKFIGAKYGIVAISEDVMGYSAGFVNSTKKTYGVQAGFITLSDRVVGMQDSLISVNTSMKGFQAGLVNVSENFAGFQLGLVNYTKTMDGLQVGLVNIITRSKLPVMVIANARFE